MSEPKRSDLITHLACGANNIGAAGQGSLITRPGRLSPRGRIFKPAFNGFNHWRLFAWAQAGSIARTTSICYQFNVLAAGRRRLGLARCFLSNSEIAYPMKVVLLAGGLGTRISEETQVKPKPMVEIGGQPILWHIMMLYSKYGFNDFIVCLGYKGYVIKEYFANSVLHRSDVTVDLAQKQIDYVRSTALPPWRVTLVDTGDESLTGGRLKRVGHLLPADEPFCMTYGDGVADIDINALVAFHRSHGL